MTGFIYECNSKDGINELIIKISGKEHKMSIPCNVTNNEILCNFLMNCLCDHDRYREAEIKFASLGLILI